ncbi:MAG: hypothetical protein IH626_21055 [Rhodospirillales bacterium]|nr:hypothetical protein [Rhodospirillales bacterium]
MTQHRQQITDLEDGELQIYVRADTRTPRWHARMINPVGKGYLTKTLKTINKEKAKSRAKEWYDEVRFKLKHGMNVRTQTVPQVCSLYVKGLEEEITAGIRPARHLKDYKPTAERYIKGFFGTRHIDGIKAKDIAAFQDWCRTYWTSGPGALQKNKVYMRNGKRVVAPSPRRRAMTRSGMANVMTVLRGVFKTAEKYDAIKPADVPTIKPIITRREKRDPNSQMSRAAFSLEEYRQLYRFLRHWHKTGRDEESRQRRELLRDYVLFLINSGIRPGTESDGLCWKHISPFIDPHGTEHVLLSVRGKTGERQPVAMPYTKNFLSRIRQRREKVLGHPVSPDEYVFCLPDGPPVKAGYFAKLFDKALKEAGLLRDTQGRKRVLYSCRHTYATLRLIYGRVSIYTLAENMGTSVQMIEHHYGHLTPTLAAAELTQRNRPRKVS